MKILFVENYSMNSDNPMSTLYPLKCNKIKESKYFDVYDISKSEKISNNYDKVLFGTRSLYLY